MSRVATYEEARTRTYLNDFIDDDQVDREVLRRVERLGELVLIPGKQNASVAC